MYEHLVIGFSTRQGSNVMVLHACCLLDLCTEVICLNSCQNGPSVVKDLLDDSRSLQ